MSQGLWKRALCPLALFMAMGMDVLSAQSSNLEISGKNVRIEYPGPGYRFRFQPDQDWLAFDRPLELSSESGEERLYELDIEKDGSSSRRAVLIDKRPPLPPSHLPGGGLYENAIDIRLQASGASLIRYALLDGEAGRGEFLAYPSDGAIRLDIPDQGSRTVALLSYAEDPAGNRSRMSRSLYRLGKPGLKLEPPPSEKKSIRMIPDPLAELPKPQERRRPEGVELVFPKPAGSRLIAAVNPKEGLSSPEYYGEVEERDGRCILILETPHGWSGELAVVLGLDDGIRQRYRPEPLRITIEKASTRPDAPPTPQDPELVAGPPGAGGFLAFPPYEGTIRVSLDGSSEFAYIRPLAVEPGAKPVLVAWRGERPGQGYSAPKALSLSRPPALPAEGLGGLDAPVFGNAPIRLTCPATRLYRYEISSDGSLPSEPTAASPLFPPELLLDCPIGETRTFSLRYRAYTGSGSEALGGDSRLLSYTIDKKAPEAPVLASKAPKYSQETASLSLRSEEGRIMVSVGAPGESVRFSEYSGPINLPGSPDGALVYQLRAYVIDAAGNRSPQLGPLTWTIDSSTYYADSDARTEGDGSPESPFKSLEAAIKAARDGGRRRLLLRGRFRLEQPEALSGLSLEIHGGFGPEWLASPTARVGLALAAATDAAPSLELENSELVMRSLDIQIPESSGSLIAVRGGTLDLQGVTITSSTRSDLIVLDLASTRLLLKDSGIIPGGSGRVALMSARASRIELTSSSLGVLGGFSYFSGLDLEGGSLLMRNSNLSGQGSLGAILLSASGSGIEIDRSSLSASGGPGYVRIGRLRNSSGEVRNARIELKSEGGASLFEMTASPVAFIFSTLIGQARGTGLRFFETRGGPPSFVNSIAFAPLGGAGFMSVDQSGGRIGASGFGGFSSLVSGAVEAQDIEALKRIFGDSSVSPSVEIPLQGSFQSLPKYGLVPAKGSPVLDAASPLLDAAYQRDFRGNPRPSGFGKKLPDMGADEFSD